MSRTRKAGLLTARTLNRYTIDRSANGHFSHTLSRETDVWRPSAVAVRQRVSASTELPSTSSEHCTTTIISNWKAAVRIESRLPKTVEDEWRSGLEQRRRTSTATVRASHDDAGHGKTSAGTVRRDAGSEQRGRVLNDEADAQPVVHTVAEPPNGTAESTRRQSELPTPPTPTRNRSAPLRYAANAAPLRVTAFPLCFFFLLSPLFFSYSALVHHRFTVPLGQIAP